MGDLVPHVKQQRPIDRDRQRERGFSAFTVKTNVRPVVGPAPAPSLHPFSAFSVMITAVTQVTLRQD
jgi:hypothetical protein